MQIAVNGSLVDINMKMGDAGEAFFVVANDDVTSEFATSPLPVPAACIVDEQLDSFLLDEEIKSGVHRPSLLLVDEDRTPGPQRAPLNIVDKEISLPMMQAFNERKDIPLPMIQSFNGDKDIPLQMMKSFNRDNLMEHSKFNQDIMEHLIPKTHSMPSLTIDPDPTLDASMKTPRQVRFSDLPLLNELLPLGDVQITSQMTNLSLSKVDDGLSHHVSIPVSDITVPRHVSIPVDIPSKSLESHTGSLDHHSHISSPPLATARLGMSPPSYFSWAWGGLPEVQRKEAWDKESNAASERDRAGSTTTPLLNHQKSMPQFKGELSTNEKVGKYLAGLSDAEPIVPGVQPILPPFSPEFKPLKIMEGDVSAVATRSHFPVELSVCGPLKDLVNLGPEVYFN